MNKRYDISEHNEGGKTQMTISIWGLSENETKIFYDAAMEIIYGD